MSQYATLKAAIQDVVKQNGNNEITGNLLQQALLSMIDSLGYGYQFVGIATPTTNPGTPDQKVFYIASKPGTYTNFNNIVVNDDEIAILFYESVWGKVTTGIGGENLKKAICVARNSVQNALVRSQMYFKDFSHLVVLPFEVSYWESSQFNPILLASAQRTVDFLDANNYLNPESVWDGEQPLYAQLIWDGNFHIVRYNEEKYELSEYAPVCQVYLSTDGSKIVRAYIPLRNDSDIVDVEHITVGKSFNERDVLIATELQEEDGLINEDGTLDISATGYKSCSPIAIPSGVNYVLFGAEIEQAVPNYVNCYSGPNFTGFLGRSDGMAWQSLNHSLDNLLRAMELPAGTKYISFLTNNSREVAMSLSVDIYGASVAHFGTFYNGLFVPTTGMEEKVGDPSTNVHFSIPVNCHLANVDDETTDLQDGQEIYSDYGVLMLPDDYSRNGKPTRLVIGCHGAGGDVTVQDSQTERAVEYQYMVANGFAVMDMSGLPQAWADLKGIDRLNNIGSPIAMECYIKGYEYVVKHFNICPDGVLVSGGSMGGISSSNLVLSKMIPVIAQGINCPVLDTYNQIWLHPWSGGAPKVAMQKIYGMGNTYDESKLCGYNPIVNGMQTFDENGNRVTSVGAYDFTTHKLNGADVVEYREYPCPLKIWHSDDDPVVAPAISARQINAIRNAGGQAWLRKIISGGHGPLTVGSVLMNPAGSNVYRGALLQIKPIVEEEFLFFKRFANVSPTLNGWEIVSNEQTSQNNGYYTPDNTFYSSTEIFQTDKITIPAGKTQLRFVTSEDWVNVNEINCYDENGDFVGPSGMTTNFGANEPLGQRIFTLPAGTRKISYIYFNHFSPNNWTMGLNCRIIAK